MKREEEYIFFHRPEKIKQAPMLTSILTSQTEIIENIISKNNDFNYINPFSKETKTKPLTNSYNKDKYIKKRLIKNSVKLPLLINKNNISSFEKRKNYKIIFPEKYANLTYVNKRKDENPDAIFKKKNFVNYFLKKSETRKKKINEILDEINETEDRFNKEIPSVDSNLVSKDKILVDNKWKNSFYLDEYQQFFMKHLKGKISSMNYRQMLQKFRDISIMCFSPGNEHNIPKKIKYIE